ncbi:hypothetical protein [Duganella callida]|uniref:Uncharacterized protein n=1 Tax=Duganella callida TaxID=2561932 RepID=A0A4Y9S450_9BURK|nr:hypothetical protein [Duganella callida]TFW15951.1 hypothetical protein E4L98_24975 [Duganella callida]
MRISADPKSPHYSTCSRQATVFLNGEQLKHCVTADDEAGTAECYRLDANGEIFRDGEFAELQVLRGQVEIVLEDMDFDAWLRRRTERAHADFMARTSRLPA